MTARQRQPAFGRKVRQWRESGLAPSTDIFLSLGWAYGRAWQWRIVIPDDVDPAELFRGLPFVWRGRLQMLGAENVRVRADWDKMNRMAFRHVERDRCVPR